jgi:hypothetical protein
LKNYLLLKAENSSPIAKTRRFFATDDRLSSARQRFQFRSVLGRPNPNAAALKISAIPPRIFPTPNLKSLSAFYDIPSIAALSAYYDFDMLPFASKSSFIQRSPLL